MNDLANSESTEEDSSFIADLGWLILASVVLFVTFWVVPYHFDLTDKRLVAVHLFGVMATAVVLFGGICLQRWFYQNRPGLFSECAKNLITLSLILFAAISAADSIGVATLGLPAR